MAERDDGAPAPEQAETLRVIAAFFEGGRLKALPVKRRKRMIVLGRFAARFAPGVAYPEKEVNAVISRMFDDYCAIRRDLVDFGFMARDKGIYWRLERAPDGE